MSDTASDVQGAEERVRLLLTAIEHSPHWKWERENGIGKDLRAILSALTAAEARAEEAEMEVPPFPANEDLAAIGVVGRAPVIAKHRAWDLANIRDAILTLDARDLRAEADTIAWLVWARVLDHQREGFLVKVAEDAAAAWKADAAGAHLRVKDLEARLEAHNRARLARVFHCENCGSGPWTLAWANGLDALICPNCSGAD